MNELIQQNQLSEAARSYAYQDLPNWNILRLVPPDGQVIGTIGCGYATTEYELVKRGRQIHGVDVSASAIERAGTRLTSARVVDPSNEMPFAQGSLDGLILADVIEHMPSAHLRLRRYASMLKIGGWAVISVPNMRHWMVLHQLALRGDWPEHPLGIFDDTHVQVMTHRRLERWATDAGLRLERWQDAYESRFLRRNIDRAINLASFKLLRGFVTYQVQGLFRRIC
ncbi:MAG: class I SAM-dependent methyltransferase [Pseudomonadota bacterium]